MKKMLNLKKLKCLHMAEPIGIDENPYFSWQMESDEMGVMQASYRMIVTDESGKVVWDTGIVLSDSSTYIRYEGNPLESSTRYDWHVEVTDNHGNHAAADSVFETALLDKKEWKAKWVKSPLPTRERAAHLGEQPCASLFRKEFTLQKSVKRARLYATCHGVYQLTVNGIRPDDREFAPECTVYREYLCYQTYDVTELLELGQNVIGMHVGDGWYHGFMTKAEDESYDPAHAVLLQMDVVYEDGSMETVLSDKGIKVGKSAVLCSDLFAGEIYDANQMLYGWDKPDADSKTDFAEWENAIEADFGYANLRAQLGQPVRPVMLLPVKEILVSPKGEKIIDFGQVIAGRVRMHVNVPKGTKIVISHTEGLDAQGNFFDNNPTADQRIEFISDGREQVYEPHFTFQGFRYITVSGVDELRAEDYTAVVLSSEKDDIGTFSCSNVDVTRLYENTRWSQRANMLSIPTDCPQREKAGWTGDIQVYTKTALLNEDISPLLTRWLENLAVEQKDNGSVPFVVPLAGAYIGMYKGYEQQFGTPDAVSPAGWGDAAVLIPYYMYQVTGNTEILKKQYDSMKKWCDFVLETARKNRPEDSTLPDEIEQYLWNTGHHYGEHLIPSYSKDGYGEKTFEAIRVSTKYVAPIYCYYSLTGMSGTAEILGYKEDAAYYSDKAEKVRDAFSKGVIDEEGNMPAELMGAYAMPIYYGLVPEKLKDHFAEKLVQILNENNGCLDTGFLGMPALQDALCKIGRTDLAYDLLFQEQAPSWLYEVRHGATTIWESWFALDEDGTPFCSQLGDFVFTMSLNHYAFGCVDDWIFRNVNGIDRLEPGYKKILIRPQLDDRLSWAKRSFNCEFGDIVTEWEKKAGKFQMKVSIPCNTTAVIVMPDGTEYEKGSGTYEFCCAC